MSGAAQVGGILSAAAGAWANAPTGYSYQWQDCSSTGTSCTDIAGATHSEYTVSPSDVQHTLAVAVTATNTSGSGAAASSPATGDVPAKAEIYVAQSSTGAADGSSCGNAHSAEWLDTGANWGSGAGQIAPGAVVHLCGTITSQLVAQGSGSSGQPIVIYWEPGASVQQPYCPERGTGCININGRSYITLDGGVNGSVLSTENGTNLSNHVGNANGVSATNCTGCTVESLSMSNMYVEAAGSNDCTSSGSTVGLWFSGSDFTMANNTFHDEETGAIWLPGATDANISMHGNSFYNDGTGMDWVSATNGGGSIGPVLFYDNKLSAFSGWDTSGDCYHEDGIHCWDSPGYAPVHYNGIYIYDNRWSGIGVNATAYIFMEGGSGGGATICADSTSPIYVFNNVFSTNVPINNGLLSVTSGEPRLYNNTMLGTDNSEGVCETINSDAVNAISENEVMSTCGAFRYNNNLPVYAQGQPNHDVYANGGGNAWVCGGSYIPFGAFSEYLSCIRASGGGGSGAETSSRTSAGTALNAEGRPEAGSPVLGAGANLSGLCTEPHLSALCQSIEGAPRPKEGPWNAGAY